MAGGASVAFPSIPRRGKFMAADAVVGAPHPPSAGIVTWIGVVLGAERGHDGLGEWRRRGRSAMFVRAHLGSRKARSTEVLWTPIRLLATESLAATHGEACTGVLGARGGRRHDRNELSEEVEVPDMLGGTRRAAQK
eukprot:3580834-Pyramimonas_sp.AAC.1